MNTFRRWRYCRRFLRLLFAVLGSVCVPFPGAANGPRKPLSQYLREEWGSEKGFPGGPINAIAQTRDGYLWLGTQKGLVRFDGWTFRLFSQTSTDGNPIGSVLGLVADAEGSLWVRLEGSGLLRYRDGKFEDFSNTFDSPETAVTQMCRDADGRAIFATVVNGTLAYDHGKFTSVAPNPGLANFVVTAVATGPQGAYWLGTRDLGLYDTRQGKISARRDVLTERKINALLSVGGKQLWIGTDTGLLLWNGHQRTRIGPDSPLSKRQILSLSEDGDGNIWAGTDHGVYRLDPESDFAPKTENTQADGPVSAILPDREGNIWIATPRGLQRLRNTIFTSYGLTDGLPEESNGPVHVDSDGRTWFAPIRGGLYWLKGMRVGLIREGGLDKDVVYSIAGGNGDLWVGRQLGGLTHLQNVEGKWHAVSYTTADGLAQNSVYTVRLSRDGTVWAGTLSEGLTRIKSGKFETFTTEKGLISNTIASILESRDGRMWIATPRGLSAFSNGHWLSYSSKDGLPSDDVNCLFEDSTGTLWIGTMNGLAALRSGNIWAPAQGPDLLHEPIFGLRADTNGSLWISTSNHIAMVSREKLLQSDFDAADIRQFGHADGLSTTEGVKRDEAVDSDNSGKIWFGLNRVLSVVDTNRLRTDSAPAILHLEALSVDGKLMLLQNSARISPNPRRITISYAGISLSVPERVRFKYKLDGFDRIWSEAVASHEVNYTNLNPGPYLFRVIASNSDGLWNGTELKVPFTIEPVIWSTWWFRTTYVAVILLSVWCAYRYRLYRLAKQYRIRLEERVSERTRIARELHDSLLQGFHGLIFRFQTVREFLPERPSEAMEALDIALERADKVIVEGRDTVSDLRQSVVGDSDIGQALTSLGEELAAQSSNGALPCVRVLVEGKRRDLDPMLRDEVYRIAREALRNAFRHAQAQKIEAEITYSDSQFLLHVRDDGRGIDPKVTNQGARAGHWGLPGMRERAKRFGGRLEVWSEQGAGTEIELTLPAAIAYGESNAGPRFWFLRKKKQAIDERKS